jgi:thioredoxin reductase (NADPH)
MTHVHDLIVIGAGPAGLAAAIEASALGLDYAVLERGTLVDTVRRYPTNMVFFTTAELLEIGNLPFVTPHDKPTRFEALRYYRRAADRYRLRIELGHEVVRVEAPRDPAGAPLTVEVRTRLGGIEHRRARHVVVAVGAFDRPNRLGIPGEDLPHVSHYYGESHPYFRQRVVVVGGKNSAAEAALELHRNGASVSLVHRGARLGGSIKYWVKPDIENRIAEGSIPAYFEARLTAIDEQDVHVTHRDRELRLPADAVLLLTGYHSDLDFFERAGIAYDAATLAPEVDPETFESNVPHLYVIGSAITGRQSGQIFIENGRFHGRTVVGIVAARLGRGRAVPATTGS